MHKKVNILFLLAFVFSLAIVSCTKEEALTPVIGVNNDLRGGNANDSGDPTGGGDDGGTITDPNDDEDSEIHTGKGKKGKSSIADDSGTEEFQGDARTESKR